MPEIGYINEYYKVGNRMIIIMNSTKDITAGTEFYLHTRKPSGLEVTYEGVLNGDSSVQGVVPSEDNDEAGPWWNYYKITWNNLDDEW